MPNQHTGPLTLAERFWAHVEYGLPAIVCWEWQGKHDRHGYGRLNKPDFFGHRLSWLVHYGSLPVALAVCHRCDNPGCVNPSHLFLGTQGDNLADMTAKGRRIRGDQTTFRKYPHLVRRGERSNTAKLTEAQVVRIRERYAAGNITQQVLADEYGVTDKTIAKIVLRQRWRHVGATGD